MYVRRHLGLRNDGGHGLLQVAAGRGSRVVGVLAHLGGPPDFQADGTIIRELEFNVTGQNGPVDEQLFVILLLAANTASEDVIRAI